VQVVAERGEPARANLDRGERLGQRADRLAVDARGVEEPAFLLVRVAELGRLGQVLAHVAHPRPELRHRFAEGLVRQVPLHLMPVLHRRHVAQRGGEEGREIVLVPSGGHRGEDLVEVQITEQRGIFALGRRRGAVEKNAVERPCRAHSSLHRHVVRQKPSATAAVSGELHHLTRLYPTITSRSGPAG
jgi:hypothetical protein